VDRQGCGCSGFAVIAGLLYLSRKLEKRGVRNYSCGLDRGLLQVDTMLRPSKQYLQPPKQDNKATAG
jgi:hypothetical protein